MLHPVIISGGVGSRLWPLSRATYPKQLHALNSELTLLQETLQRVGDRGRFAAPLVACHVEQRFMIDEQLREIGETDATILLEPEGRNTAPAIVAAAAYLDRLDPEATILVLPADHAIGQQDRFLAAVEHAAQASAQGFFVTFGIEPTGPETGFGYIKLGEALNGSNEAFRVARFHEKPDLARAEQFLAEGGFCWNSGMFVFPVKALLGEINALAPDILSACQSAVGDARRDLSFVRLAEDSFVGAPSISIDYALMERTDRAAVVPVSFGWNDVGSWSALWQIGEKDADGNVSSGDTMTLESRNNYLRSEAGQILATVGLEDTVVVATKDAILVADRTASQSVGKIFERLKQDGRSQWESHVEVFRPWGSYQQVDEGTRFQVKRLVVKPGEKLSLQRHHHRAEHWIVVKGTAKVTRDDETFLITENESVYLPLGCRHRLENPGKILLEIIEVQVGSYLGEDDIVRYADDYNREEG